MLSFTVMHREAPCNAPLARWKYQGWSLTVSLFHQIKEDVSKDYRDKTITKDPFPHSSFVTASVHPCKHASTVKKLGQMAEAGGKEFKVEK